MVQNTKGVRAEREFAQYFDEAGWQVIRSPASGSSTSRDQPDVFMGDGVRSLAIEVKRSSERPIYIAAEEVDALRRFAEAFQAQPRVAVKFDVKPGDDAWGENYPGFYILPPSDLYRTDSGYYRVKKQEAVTLGIREADLAPP